MTALFVAQTLQFCPSVCLSVRTEWSERVLAAFSSRDRRRSALRSTHAGQRWHNHL